MGWAARLHQQKDNPHETRGWRSNAARIIKRAVDIQAGIVSVQPGPAPAKPKALIRTTNGNPMAFFSDGSLRHATGFKPGKAARKLRKQMRRGQ